MGDVMRYGIYVLGAYNDCAARHDTLIEAVR
jgi:hypothetical protein